MVLDANRSNILCFQHYLLSLFSKIEKMSFAGVLADADVKAALAGCAGKRGWGAE